jgi:hypothetical protein
MKRIYPVFFLVLVTLMPVTISFAQQPAPATYGISDDAINAYPAPDVQPIYPDDSLLYDRRYEKVSGPLDIFDAPGGNLINTLGAGFVYVTGSADQNGWTQIDDGEWVQTASLTDVTGSVSRYAGVQLTKPLPYPMGWILVNVVPSHTPGADPLDGDLAVLRYTRVNLYSAVDVDGWTWYQIGVNQWVNQTRVAKYIPIQKPEGVDTVHWVSVDLYEQVLVAYEDTTPVFTTLISSGLRDWATTEGLFHVYVRYPRTIMSGAEGQDDFYFLEEVPWTQYFDGDQGLHGTYWHDGFGYRHSHGCVNMSITDAKWIYDWASSEIDFTVPNDTGAAVYVYSSGEYK